MYIYLSIIVSVYLSQEFYELIFRIRYMLNHLAGSGFTCNVAVIGSGIFLRVDLNSGSSSSFLLAHPCQLDLETSPIPFPGIITAFTCFSKDAILYSLVEVTLTIVNVKKTRESYFLFQTIQFQIL